MKRHEVWRLEYRRRPYLANVSDDYLKTRLCDVASNITQLSPDGKIGLVIDDNLMNYWTPRFTHILEEYARRGSMQPDVSEVLNIPTPTFPTLPNGARAFQKITIPDEGSFIAKFTKQKHAEALLSEGQVYVSPASAYKDSSLNRAMCDDELSVHKFIRKNNTRVTILDQKTGKSKEVIPLSSDIKVTTTSNTDFYVWCTASSLDLRLFEDFEADACVIIRDIDVFKQRLKQAMSAKLPNWEFSCGAVNYIDPYLHSEQQFDPFACKHFSYAYQKEFRFIWIPPSPVSDKLKPHLLTLGNLEDICEMVVV